MALTKTLTARYSKLKKPKIDSASNVVLGAIGLIRDYCNSESFDRKLAYEEIKRLLPELVHFHSGNAQLINLTNIILSALNRSKKIKKNDLISLCDAMKLKLQQETASIARQTLQVLPNKSIILTYSYSGSVLNALFLAKNLGHQFSVICAESKPLNEGYATAKLLNNKDIPATLIADVDIQKILPRVELILLGGDAIINPNFVSKNGTYEICLAANKLSRPVYCLCGSSKFLAKRWAYFLKEKNQEEDIQKEIIERLKKDYLELIPLELLTGLITDIGILNKLDVDKIVSSETLHPLQIHI